LKLKLDENFDVRLGEDEIIYEACKAAGRETRIARRKLAATDEDGSRHPRSVQAPAIPC
jgi:hypothetical protein